MEQIIQQISQMLQQGVDPQQVLQQLVQAGIPQEQAQQAIQQVMSQGQEQPMMQKGGLAGFNPKPTYNAGSDLVNTAMYNADFYNTPNLALTPSRVDNSPANYGWNDYEKHKTDTDLDWLLHEALPYNIISGNQRERTISEQERNAYQDYQNQFKNYIQSQAKKAPKLQKFLNKATPFKFQKGGQFQPNGYDAIHPSMYSQMQQVYNQNFGQPQPLSQEQMSMQLAQQDQQAQMEMANYIAKQRRKLGKKALPKDMYNFVEKNLMNTPEIKRLVNPNTILANQFNMGGSIYSKRKLKKCK